MPAKPTRRGLRAACLRHVAVLVESVAVGQRRRGVGAAVPPREPRPSPSPPSWPGPQCGCSFLAAGQLGVLRRGLALSPWLCGLGW